MGKKGVYVAFVFAKSGQGGSEGLIPLGLVKCGEGLLAGVD